MESSCEAILGIEVSGVLLDAASPVELPPASRLTGLLYHTQGGALRRVRYGEDGRAEPLWETQLEPGDANVYGGHMCQRLVLRSSDSVVAHDVETGERVWRHTTGHVQLEPLVDGEALRLLHARRALHLDVVTGSRAPLQPLREPRWFRSERRIFGWNEVPYLFDQLDGLSVCCEDGVFYVEQAPHHRAGPVAAQLSPEPGEHRPQMRDGWQPSGYVMATPRGWLAPLHRDDAVALGLFDSQDFGLRHIMSVGRSLEQGLEYLDLWQGSSYRVVMLCLELSPSAGDTTRPAFAILDLEAGRTLGVVFHGLEPEHNLS